MTRIHALAYACVCARTQHHITLRHIYTRISPLRAYTAYICNWQAHTHHIYTSHRATHTHIVANMHACTQTCNTCVYIYIYMHAYITHITCIHPHMHEPQAWISTRMHVYKSCMHTWQHARAYIWNHRTRPRHNTSQHYTSRTHYMHICTHALSPCMLVCMHTCTHARAPGPTCTRARTCMHARTHARTFVHDSDMNRQMHAHGHAYTQCTLTLTNCMQSIIHWRHACIAHIHAHMHRCMCASTQRRHTHTHHTPTHIYMHTYMHKCMRACMCVCSIIRTYISTHACTHACKHACMHATHASII